MKKIFISFLCLCLLALVFTSCDGGAGTVTSSTPSKETTGSTPLGTTGPSIDDSTPIGSTPEGSLPEGSTPEGSMPEGSMPDGSNSDSTTAGTVLTTLPLFARLDFGTATFAEENRLTTHDYIVSILTYNSEFVSVEFTEDTLRLTAVKDGTFTSAAETASLSDSRYYKRGTNTCFYGLSDFAICFDDIVSYDFEEELRSGYGTWANFPFNFDRVGNPEGWRGYHQYMKLRIKNPTQNDKIAVQFNNSVGYASTQFMVMSVGKEKPDFDTYIYDLCYAATYPSGKGVLLAGQNPGNNWTWKQDTVVRGLRFHLLGSTCSYANAFLDNQLEEGETAADRDKYAEYFNRLDSRELIRKGNVVEIDYILFGSTPEGLMSYKSRMESEA